MDDQLQSVANRLLVRQKGVDKEMSEMMASEEGLQAFRSNEQQPRPIRIEELPAPLRKLYTKSVQDPTSNINNANNNNNNNSGRESVANRNIILNEPLMGGFALLRVTQLLNIDVYYIGLESRSGQLFANENRFGSSDLEALAGKNQVRSCPASEQEGIIGGQACYRTFLDDLASYNPLQKHIDRYKPLRVACRLAKIFLSLTAIMIGFNEILSTIVLCLMTIERKLETNEQISNTNNNSSMGLFVLVLVQFSSIYILFSTIFNGHLLWNLFSQRQFLISRRFQYKTMLKLLIFIYLEYMINIAFVSNLYDWDFTSNNIESGSYSVLANLRILVTFKDFDHFYVDILMTMIAFARGIIRISPYITINYAMICLKEHINTIRNQRLLTDSLKKRQKLRLVVGKTNRRRNESKAMVALNGGRTKKKVNFVTEPMGHQAVARVGGLANGETSIANSLPRRQTLGAVAPSNQHRQQVDLIDASAQSQVTVLDPSESSQRNSLQKFAQTSQSNQENLFGARIEPDQANTNSLQQQQRQQMEMEMDMRRGEKRHSKDLFLERIGDFDELESYITNMYIFTGKLNRFMSSQGLTVFFIVHNLVISVSLIIPEAINGGIIMVQFIRLLLILIAILPFIIGQSLSGQLEQLSKQIDRIIIQQHFIHRRRDNLVRIRELIHDIRVNCGGMLNFNVATGIKYLVVAFASAFFIEQEHYKLTRRNKADDTKPTMSWVVGFPMMTSGGAS